MKSCIISILFLSASLSAAAVSGSAADIRRCVAVSLQGDSVAADITDSAGAAAVDTTVYTIYDRRIYRYRNMWNSLIPTQFITQFAGNMGMLSVGVGWDYGRRSQFETNLLVGYLPKFHSSSAKITMTLKQNFVPWRLPVGSDFHFEPLSCGIYFNTVFGQEFWSKQPKRYPDKYYPFLSTKVRINVFAGQRFSVIVPHNRRKFIKSLTAFYEVNTCDLYVRAMVQDSNVSLWDAISLSLGLKFQLL